MAQLQPGEVEFVVGDRRFVLAMKTRALMALQKHFRAGDRIVEVQKLFEAAEGGSVEHLAAIIWASFQKYHPEVTFDQALNLIDEAGGLEQASAQLQALHESTTPDPEDVRELSEGNPLKAQTRAGRGARSRSKANASV